MERNSEEKSDKYRVNLGVWQPKIGRSFAIWQFGRTFGFPKDENSEQVSLKMSNSTVATGLSWIHGVGAAAVTSVTAATVGTVGAIGTFLGCTSTGIAAGSAMAGMMSTAATSGVGMGLVSALQSAGTVFAAATGGSAVLATGAVAAPLLVGGYYIVKAAGYA